MCGPNEAMVVSGFCCSSPVMIAGGQVFVLPCIQQIERISLSTLTLNVKSEKIYTRHGVPISVTGIAQVKNQGQNKEMLAAACQMFLGKTEREIAQITLETLEGHQRAIMAHMTVEEIYEDRKKFSEQEATATQQKASVQYVNKIKVAKAQRDYELKKAVPTWTKHRIEEEKMQVQVVERTQKIQLQSRRSFAGRRSSRLGSKNQLKPNMTKKTEAFWEYKDAALVDMLLEKLPLVVVEISKPFTQVKKVTTISSGGEVGAAKLISEVLEIMNRLPDTVEKLTGVNIIPHSHKPGRMPSAIYFVMYVRCNLSNNNLHLYSIPHKV
uniref:Flotillin n=1 Tax=Callorhinchus milii TaxID=7868 RepID=A0A4W3HCM2_CALMI